MATPFTEIPAPSDFYTIADLIATVEEETPGRGRQHTQEYWGVNEVMELLGGGENDILSIDSDSTGGLAATAIHELMEKQEITTQFRINLFQLGNLKVVTGADYGVFYIYFHRSNLDQVLELSRQVVENRNA